MRRSSFQFNMSTENITIFVHTSYNYYRFEIYFAVKFNFNFLIICSYVLSYRLVIVLIFFFSNEVTLSLINFGSICYYNVDIISFPHKYSFKREIKISRCIVTQGCAVLESFETAVDTIICNFSDSQMLSIVCVVSFA